MAISVATHRTVDVLLEERSNTLQPSMAFEKTTWSQAWMVPAEHNAALSYASVGDKRVACFVIGGEPRLCLPQVVKSCFAGIDFTEISRILDDLNIYVQTASDKQIEALKLAEALPREERQCLLIRKSDVERIMGEMPFAKHGSDPPRFLNESERLSIKHSCFGGCKGLLFPSLYPMPCIQCEECAKFFEPSAFLVHNHNIKEYIKTVHWGFDPQNWRLMLKLQKCQRHDLKALAVMRAFLDPSNARDNYPVLKKRSNVDNPSDNAFSPPKKPFFDQIIKPITSTITAIPTLGTKFDEPMPSLDAIQDTLRFLTPLSLSTSSDILNNALIQLLNVKKPEHHQFDHNAVDASLLPATCSKAIVDYSISTNSIVAIPGTSTEIAKLRPESFDSNESGEDTLDAFLADVLEEPQLSEVRTRIAESQRQFRTRLDEVIAERDELRNENEELKRHVALFTAFLEGKSLDTLKPLNGKVVQHALPELPQQPQLLPKPSPVTQVSALPLPQLSTSLTGLNMLNNSQQELLTAQLLYITQNPQLTQQLSVLGFDLQNPQHLYAVASALQQNTSRPTTASAPVFDLNTARLT